MNLAQHAMQLAELLRGKHFIAAFLERANPGFHRRLVDAHDLVMGVCFEPERRAQRLSRGPCSSGWRPAPPRARCLWRYHAARQPFCVSVLHRYATCRNPPPCESTWFIQHGTAARSNRLAVPVDPVSPGHQQPLRVPNPGDGRHRAAADRAGCRHRSGRAA